MNNKLILTLALLLSIVSFNAYSATPNHIRGALGFSQGSINLGVDYENRTNALGLGGYLLFSDKDDNASNNGFLALGALASLHIYENNNFDVYVAPGFGIVKFDMASGDDETTIGPILKMGVEYNITGQFAMGLQHFFVYNWLSDEAAASDQGMNVTGTFNF